MIIYAVNVNTGGGKVLLDRLLIQNPFESTSAAFLDKRYSPPAEYTGKRFSFSIISRLFAEKLLHRQLKTASPNESVLFFGNLPPFSKPKIKSYLYLQNCFLTGQVPIPTDSLREWLRNSIESWILKLFYKNVDEIWVQTEWMKALTQKQCPKADIKIRPFLPLLPQPSPQSQKNYKFTYVGSLSSNKGLTFFLTALKKLDEKLDRKIEVCVVLNNSTEQSTTVTQFANQLRNISLRVKCRINRQELFRIYESTEYLVVTSLYESYFLPIYEASHFGCRIIASKEAGYLSHLRENNDLNFFTNQQLNLIQYT